MDEAQNTGQDPRPEEPKQGEDYNGAASSQQEPKDDSALQTPQPDQEIPTEDGVQDEASDPEEGS